MALLPFRRTGIDRRARADAVYLSTYLTSRTLAHWRVTPQGAVSTSLGGQGGARPVRVIAFHPEERRVPSAPRSVESAKSYVVREGLAIDRVRVVNRSRETGLIYAAPIGYLDAMVDGDPAPGLRIEAVCPGLMLVDRLLARAGAGSPAASGRPFAVLIDLCAPGDEASEARLRRERLVIAVVFSDALAQPSVVCSVTDEPVKDIARLVLYEQKLADDAPWILFTAADVLAAAPQVDCYPAEPEWAGIPTRRIAQGLLAASALLALGGGLHALEVQRQIRSAETGTREALAQAERLQHELGALMRAHPGTLAREVGLAPLAMLDRAGALWRAGTRVSIETRGAAAEYTVTVPFAQARMNFQNRPSAYSVTERARVAAVLAIDPPAGCVRSGLHATGALNEISLVVRCENPDSALARVLPR